MGTFQPVATLVVLGCLASLTAANVYSCGGFVKSSGSTPMDYSRITVKLLTVEGHLKHEEEVNPQNGYFMIPVYSKGQYSLRVSSPDGYYFEPETVPIKLDGETDPCSRNEDIMFKLNGFSVRGVVEGAGAGLSLILSQNGKQIDSTVTKEGGQYELRAPSGKYEVSTGPSASECISRGKATVEVKNAPVDVVPSLKISGYQLTVKTTTSTQKPFGNADIKIYSAQSVDLPGVKCQKLAGKVDGIPDSHNVECGLGATGSSDGRLVVSCVPTGDFYAKASYGGSSEGETKISFAPSVKNFKVQQEKAEINFAAETASTRGRVVINGKGAEKVDLIVNGKKAATTDKDGYYVLDGLKDGQKQEVTAKVANTHFSTIKINVAFPRISLPDVVVEKFDVCGSVEKGENGGYEKLSLKDAKKAKTVTISTEKDGKFCESVAPGVYTIAPLDTKSSLTPRDLEVKVVEKAVTDLRFTHFKTDAIVRVTCIGACPTSTVSLYLGTNTLVKSAQGTDVFTFEGIGPGNYKARLDDSNRGCWEKKEVDLIVDLTKQSPSAHFIQNGFAAKLAISHEANIKWSSVDKKQLKGETKTSGNGEVTSICVPTSGRYTVALESCYKFQHQQFELVVPYESVHSEKAVAARIEGVVEQSADAKAAGPVVVKVKSSAGERELSISSSDGRFSFDEPLSTSGESLILIPTSSSHLFEPSSANVRVTGKCIKQAAQFKSFRGIFIDGSIRPVVEGVKVKTVLKTDARIVLEAISDKSGNYKIGPVKRVEDYEITALLDGYKFVPTPSQPGHFGSVKLSQLSIKVVDEATSEPLDGVLLSLVGGQGSDYRSNNILDVTASKNFVGLAPGEYYVRAIIQEYKFSPSTFTIVVKEGQHESVTLKGSRVHFSAYGKIRETSGASVRDVVVEALSSGCDQHQSEAVTTTDGKFRIRGLLPSCSYRVYAKSYADGSAAPHSFPSQFTVAMTAEDVKGLDFVATTVDKTTDVAVEIDMDSLQDVQSVRVILSRGHEQLRSTVISYPQSVYYLPRLERDGTEYTVRVEADKPADAFAAKTVRFTTDAPVRVVRVQLKSAKKSGEVDISVGSLMSLPFFICLALVFFNQQRVLEAVQSAYDSISGRSDNRKRK